MKLHGYWRSCACMVLLAYGSVGSMAAFGGMITVVDGIITNGTTQLQAVSGTAPNGNTWASYATGTNPVSYFDLSTGALMFDPKGISMNGVDYRYGTTTITATTPGVFVYTTGSGNPGAVSTSSIERTFPAGSWLAVTTFQARVGGQISAGTPLLSTTGGNIASTDGSFNLPWSFGAVAPSLINSQATLYSTSAGQGFRSLTTGGNLLGYGNGIGMFAYTPVGGVQLFSVVVPVAPIAVPEPSTVAMAGLGLAALAAHVGRRLKEASAN